MATTSPTTMKNRLVALWLLISGVTTSIDDYPEDGKAFKDAELVVAITRLGQAANSALTKSSFLMTRTVTTHLIVARASSSRPSPDTSAMEAVEAYMERVPLFFAARPQLQNPATGLGPLVNSITLPSEQEPGPGRFAFGGVEYWGLLYTYQIETLYRT